MSSIYVHWPFCTSKCTYCNFYSVIQSEVDYELWIDMYDKVLQRMSYFFRSEDNKETITSIFFGGGTPSLAPAYFFVAILDKCAKYFTVSNDTEITIEANPCTLNKNKILALKASGINRLSIGVQSLNNKNLNVLGRKHTGEEAVKILNTSAEIFDNISADFIYNIPNQSISEWERELVEISSLPLKHISLYELIVEDGTQIATNINNGVISNQILDDNVFMETTNDVIANSGFKRYEISNFAKPGYMCKHSLSYWNYDKYYSVGPSSHSRVIHNGKKYAIEQIPNKDKWIAWAKAHGEFDMVELTDIDIFREQLIMGLRTIFGVDINSLPPGFLHQIQEKSKKLEAYGLIKRDKDKITLTDASFMRLNSVVEYLA